jgi:hypothetical protein
MVGSSLWFRGGESTRKRSYVGNDTKALAVRALAL